MKQLLALALVWLTCSPASAALITVFNENFHMKFEDGSFSGSFAGFDTSLGTLTGVRVVAGYTSGSNMQIGATNITGVTLLSPLTHTAMTDVAVGGKNIQLDHTKNILDNFGFNGNGSFGWFDQPIPSGYDSSTISTGLDAFLAPLLDLSVDATSVITTKWNQYIHTATSYRDTYLNVRVLYDYTPIYPVPEPATLALLGLGLAGFAMRRKFS